MLAAKVEETCIISIWHYFCLEAHSYSVYLTGINNNYPISIVINKILKLERQGAGGREQRATQFVLLFSLKSLIPDS
jgi:hypothetical protein